jgi:hypothetical protein
MDRDRLVAAALGAVVALALGAGAHAAPHGAYHASRTAYGQPDLQGTWSNASQTGLERPPGEPLTFATRAQEAAFMRRELAGWRADEADGLGQGVSEWHPEFGFARIGGRLRTSWIVSPADGRLPWIPAARARFQAMAATFAGEAVDNPEERSVFERCLAGGLGSADPPMLNPVVSPGKQIVQTKDEVAILSEMNHDVRIVRIGGRHQPAQLHPWMGDSIGWWEGETLVVETTGFHPLEAFRFRMLVSPQARVTERFTRVAKDQILYAFEVDDPANYTAVWKAEMPLAADPGRIFEYACHEGERDLEVFLAAARARDAAASAGR